MLFDAADLAIIETHPYTSELERKLVAEIRAYREREAKLRRLLPASRLALFRGGYR